MEKNKKKLLSKGYVIACMFFFYAPIFVLMFFSFNSSKSLTKFSGFSTMWYSELFKNEQMMDAVWVSLTIAIIATVISTALGTITAIGLSKSKKIIKEVILTVNDLPVLNPEIVTAISLMLFFTSLNIQKGYMTMLIAHIIFCTPYALLAVLPKVRQLDPNLAEAGMDLGATPFQTLWKVILPQIKPGIFAAALIAFTMSFDDFIISYFVTGNGIENISIVVYNMTKRTNPSINALSTIVIVVIMLILVVINVVPEVSKRRKEKKIKALKALNSTNS